MEKQFTKKKNTKKQTNKKKPYTVFLVEDHNSFICPLVVLLSFYFSLLKLYCAKFDLVKCDTAIKTLFTQDTAQTHFTDFSFGV